MGYVNLRAVKEQGILTMGAAKSCCDYGPVSFAMSSHTQSPTAGSSVITIRQTLVSTAGEAGAHASEHSG